MPGFLNTLHNLKPVRPEFSCLTGCEEILFLCLVMGADGGTIATSGVVPELVMRLYEEFQRGNLSEAKRIKFKLLDLINAMLYGTNSPERFRAGMSLRGFSLGISRQLLSPMEKANLEDIRSKIACILTDYGFQEAAYAGRSGAGTKPRLGAAGPVQSSGVAPRPAV